MTVFWDIARCSPVEEDSPWWWRQQGPLKRWKTSTRLHGATTQKKSSSYSPPWEPQILHNLVEIYRCFRGAYCLRHQGELSICTRLHGATFQKTVIFILASHSMWLYFCIYVKCL
jgi:hypothetical protein